MFQSQVIGNLGADASIEKDTTGKQYVYFCVAHTEYTKDEHKNPIERTVWMGVRWYGFTEKVLTCLKKGTKIFASGRTSSRAYVDKNGEPQPGLSMLASDVTLCGTKIENAAQ